MEQVRRSDPIDALRVGTYAAPDSLLARYSENCLPEKPAIDMRPTNLLCRTTPSDGTGHLFHARSGIGLALGGEMSVSSKKIDEEIHTVQTYEYAHPVPEHLAVVPFRLTGLTTGPG